MKFTQPGVLGDFIQRQILFAMFGNIATGIGDRLLRFDVQRSTFRRGGHRIGAAVVVKKKQNMIERQTHPGVYHGNFLVENIPDFVHIAGNFAGR